VYPETNASYSQSASWKTPPLNGFAADNEATHFAANIQSLDELLSSDPTYAGLGGFGKTPGTRSRFK